MNARVMLARFSGRLPGDSIKLTESNELRDLKLRQDGLQEE
jgi:hypothetical protein